MALKFKNVLLGMLGSCTALLISDLQGEPSKDNGLQVPSLIARKDYQVNAQWTPRKMMERDFWNCLPIEEANKRQVQMRDVNQEPMVKEAAKSYRVTSLSGHPYMTDTVSISAFQTVIPEKNVPFFIWSTISRPPYNCMKDFKHDTKNYEAWKKHYYNFAGFVGGSEWCNEFMEVMKGKPEESVNRMNKGVGRFTDDEVFANIKKELPQPQNKEEALEALRKCHNAVMKYYFNDPAKLCFMRSFCGFDHAALEWGADIVWHETTNTGPYKHQISLFFVRGAARQYAKKWGWYIALCYNGFNDKGVFETDAEPIYMPECYRTQAQVKPDAGMSVSLTVRDRYLAYLSGANFVQSETWPASYCQYKDGNPNLWELAPHGKAMKEWYEFTQRNPGRGASYAPVGLLVPFAQGYPQWGGRPWAYGNLKYERPDYMIDAFMQTIVPLATLNGMPDKNGKENCLFNNPYGDIYDVIAPDAPGNPVSVNVLNSYKVAIILGKHNLDEKLSQRLMEYVKNGGTLIINIKQLNEHFPSAFLGFENHEKAELSTVKNPIMLKADGKEFSITEEYCFHKIKLASALPVMIDSDKNVLASMNKYGKGHVIVSTVDYMLPKNDMAGKDTGAVIKDMTSGRKFPFIEILLDRIVKEVLPVEVKGDIEYGLNKIDGGWWLYLINNNGVIKFTNTKESFDITKTARVDVHLNKLNVTGITELREQKDITFDKIKNSFIAEVGPGDVKIFKIAVQDTKTVDDAGKK